MGREPWYEGSQNPNHLSNHFHPVQKRPGGNDLIGNKPLGGVYDWFERLQIRIHGSQVFLLQAAVQGPGHDGLEIGNQRK